MPEETVTKYDGPDDARIAGRTWVCACERLRIDLTGPPNYPYIQCYCLDCHNRMRIIQEREKIKGANNFQPNGSNGMINTPSKYMKITRGGQYIGYFRAGCNHKGDDWDRSMGTINFVAECCNTLIGHTGSAHPWGFELQPDHMHGFKQIIMEHGTAPFLFSTEATKISGVKLPKELPEDMIGPDLVRAPMCDSFWWPCCDFIPMFCCFLCNGSLGLCCGTCCYSCCKPQTEWDLVGMGYTAEEWNGKKIEEIRDPKWLKWGAEFEGGKKTEEEAKNAD